jgi:hypothetical protein
MVGNGGHVQPVSVPTWVKAAVDNWLNAAGVTAGPIFRAINKAQKIGTSGSSPKVIWGVVNTGCSKCGLGDVDPHDLRRYAEWHTIPHENAFTALGWCSAPSDAA